MVDLVGRRSKAQVDLGVLYAGHHPDPLDHTKETDVQAARRYGRRLFLAHATRAGAGLMIIGTTAACASDSPAGVAEPVPSTPPQGSGVDADSSTSAPSSEPSEPPSAAAFDWRRVDLGFVSAYLLVSDDQVVVVDAGVKGSETDIEDALTELGLGWYAVEHVIFTHNHPDHIGSAAAILEAANARAYAGEADLLAINVAQEVEPVADGDEVLGLRIVATPGHTPGHISVLDPTGGVLVAGDALVGAADGGGVAGPDAAYTADMTTAIESVRKLSALQFETLLFGHGEPVEEDADARVAELADRL